MTVGTGLVLLVAVIAVVALLSLLLRPRRPRLVNGGRRRRGFGWRRMEAIKRAAAADIALVQGNERLLARPADGDQEGIL